jgi:hypothetical protein
VRTLDAKKRPTKAEVPKNSKKLHMLFKQGLIGMIDFKNSLPELHRIAMVFFVQIECIDNEIEHGLKV